MEKDKPQAEVKPEAVPEQSAPVAAAATPIKAKGFRRYSDLEYLRLNVWQKFVYRLLCFFVAIPKWFKNLGLKIWHGIKKISLAIAHEKFGFYPVSTGSYYLDAYTINFIKKKYPMVQCAVATCWEEGVKCYHTTNNSWYTFIDGGPWAPWIPSKVNSALPAASKEDDAGMVCIPHLSRDLMACFDGNGSNFGTHPQNVLRGMCLPPFLCL